MLHRSEGNPLYVEEGFWLAEEFSGTARMPEHLSDLLLARVDRLSDDTRRLLRVASTDGTSLDTEVLIKVTESQPEDVEASLREAVDANVLRPCEPTTSSSGTVRPERPCRTPPPRTSAPRTHASMAGVLQMRIG